MFVFVRQRAPQHHGGRSIVEANVRPRCLRGRRSHSPVASRPRTAVFQENVMTRTRSMLLTSMAFAVVAAVNSAYAADNSYDAKMLVADIPPAPHLDPHLVNPWGIAFNPNGFVWVADNGTGFSTLYDGFGVPAPAASPLIVQIPAAPGSTEHGKPTGIVFNGGGGFAVTSG